MRQMISRRKQTLISLRHLCQQSCARRCANVICILMLKYVGRCLDSSGKKSGVVLVQGTVSAMLSSEWGPQWRGVYCGSQSCFCHCSCCAIVMGTAELPHSTLVRTQVKTICFSDETQGVTFCTEDSVYSFFKRAK